MTTKDKFRFSAFAASDAKNLLEHIGALDGCIYVTEATLTEIQNIADHCMQMRNLTAVSMAWDSIDSERKAKI